MEEVVIGNAPPGMMFLGAVVTYHALLGGDVLPFAVRRSVVPKSIFS
jgi:hypothetical protein